MRRIPGASRMLVISFAAMCLGALALSYTIRKLIALIRTSTLLSLPLEACQSVDFREAGRIALCAEGPRFSRRFAGLAYDLRTAYGAPVPSHTAWMHARLSRWSTVRREMAIFTLPHPGRFLLRVEGLGGVHEPGGEHRIVFARPIGARMTGYIAGITLSACVLIAGLVLTILSLSGAS